MKVSAFLFALALLVLVSFGCSKSSAPHTNQPSPASSTTPVDEFASARQDFQKNCEACHGPTAEGGEVRIDDQRLKVPSLRSGGALRHSDERLIETITMGEEKMPAFKSKLRPEQITDLVKFIRKSFQGR